MRALRNQRFLKLQNSKNFVIFTRALNVKRVFSGSEKKNNLMISKLKSILLCASYTLEVFLRKGVDLR